MSDGEYLKMMGAYIRFVREMRGMTQDQLAEKMGYTSENRRSIVNKIESGRSDMKSSVLKNVAIALDVDPVDVLYQNIVIGKSDEILSLYNRMDDSQRERLISYANFLLKEGAEDADR